MPILELSELNNELSKHRAIFSDRETIFQDNIKSIDIELDKKTISLKDMVELKANKEFLEHLYNHLIEQLIP